MSPISKADLDQISTVIASSVATAIAQAFSQQAGPRAVAASAKTYRKSTFLPRGSKASADDLAGKDQRLIVAFTRKGFRNVVLMDRDDPNKPFNVRPYKGWLDQGRIVRKGQHGVKGLFHITQTDPLPAPSRKRYSLKRRPPSRPRRPSRSP